MEIMLLSAVMGLHFIIEVILSSSVHVFWAKLGRDEPEREEFGKSRVGLHEFATGVLPLVLLPVGLGLLDLARMAGLGVLCLSTVLFAAGRLARGRA